MKPPSAPPPLTDMAARKAKLEADRVELFPRWKAALEEAEGNVTKAAALLEPPITRDKGNRLTRRFKLVEYAASLRVATTGQERGRPKK